METNGLELEFQIGAPASREELQPVAERELAKLAKGHHDMTGASVSVEEESHAETPHAFRARVVVYIKPDNVSATEVEENPLTALKGALSAVARQVRERREKPRADWKKG